MPELEPITWVILIMAMVLVLAAAASYWAQQPGQRLPFFFRVATDVAILFSVVALVIELRYATLATRQDAYSQSLDYYAQLHRIEANNPNILGMLFGEGDRFTALSAADQERYQYLISLIEFYQRLWLMERDGVLDDEIWDGWERWLEDGIVTIPLFQIVWEDERHYYHPDFITYVNGKLAAAAATPRP